MSSYIVQRERYLNKVLELRSSGMGYTNPQFLKSSISPFIEIINILIETICLTDIRFRYIFAS